MKNYNLFATPNKLLKFTLTILITIVALGAIFVGFFGFNKSYEFGGYYEINIDFQDPEQMNSYLEGTTQILKNHGYTVSDARVGDKSYLQTLVIRYKGNSEANAEIIKQEIIKTFEFEENTKYVSVDPIGKTFMSSSAVKLLLPLGICLVALFLFGLIRRNLFYGLSLTIVTASSILVSLSIFAFTRSVLSVASIGIIAISAILSVVVFMYYSSVMFAKKKSHLGEKEDYQTLFNDAINESVWTIKIPALLAFIAFVALILTFNRTLIFVGLSGIICLVSGAFSAVLMGGSFYLTMLTAENDKIKNIMSRNKNKNDGENKKASNLKKAN
ncbi:MAG: hypothetical protein ACI4T8_02230 [Christensenellales bacterium]